jgi:hypothetical protein
MATTITTITTITGDEPGRANRIHGSIMRKYILAALTALVATSATACYVGPSYPYCYYHRCYY